MTTYEQSTESGELSAVDTLISGEYARQNAKLTEIHRDFFNAAVSGGSPAPTAAPSHQEWLDAGAHLVLAASGARLHEPGGGHDHNPDSSPPCDVAGSCANRPRSLRHALRPSEARLEEGALGVLLHPAGPSVLRAVPLRAPTRQRGRLPGLLPVPGNHRIRVRGSGELPTD